MIKGCWGNGLEARRSRIADETSLRDTESPEANGNPRHQRVGSSAGKMGMEAQGNHRIDHA